MRMMALYWLMSAELEQPAWVGASVFVVTGVLVTILMLFPHRRIEKVGTRLALGVSTAIAACGSALLAWLAYSGQTSWWATTTVLSVVAIANALTSGHAGSLRQEISEDQIALTVRLRASFLLARFVAGVLVIWFSLPVAWKLLAWDSQSYIPLLVFLAWLAWKMPYGVAVTETTPISLGEGFKFARSTPRLRALFGLSGSALFGFIAFSVMPEMLTKEYGAGLPAYGMWLTTTGAAAALGTLVGRILSRRKVSSNTVFALFSGASLFLVGAGLMGNFEAMNALYSVFMFLLLPFEVLVEGAQRSESRDHQRVVNKVREFQLGVVGPTLGFIGTLAGNFFGLTAREIMLAGATVQLTIALAFWAVVSKKKINLMEHS